jgi:Acetyltransferases, including N-acetylases of ribosomal proteins
MILDEPIVLSVECWEPKEKVVRNVRFMPLRPEYLKRFWEESKKFRALFTQDINNDFKKFLDLFIDGGPDGMTPSTKGLFWVVDDFVGIFYMDNIVPGIDAHVHYTFFDRKQSGRVPLVKAMLKYCFTKYGFKRFTVEIPFFAYKGTFTFVEGVGFKHEGRKRQAANFDGTWFDVNVYGMLREDILNSGETDGHNK